MTSEERMQIILTKPLNWILKQFPVCKEFFVNVRLMDINAELTFMEALERADAQTLAELGTDPGILLREFCEFLEEFGKESGDGKPIRTVTVLGGYDKSGEPELSEWSVSVGEIVSIVGPTGSGKSRLLADIECLADQDTPTGRKILVDGRALSDEERFQMEGKLVAQLSQNMNFVMDLTVEEFLKMHAQSRFAESMQENIKRCFACANELAGEKFMPDVKVTQLSGGQSRALMIADTAFMSTSPIVLIDEIENAGIDRRQAIDLLARKEKIVFISTHDPLLALGADKRIVIQNGGVSGIRTTSEEEKQCLTEIEKLDSALYRLRDSLRRGEAIHLRDLKG